MFTFVVPILFASANAYNGYQTLKLTNDVLDLLDYTNLISIDTETKSLVISDKIILKLLHKAIKKRNINSNPDISLRNFGIFVEYGDLKKIIFQPKFIKIKNEKINLHYDAVLLERDKKSGLTSRLLKKATSDLRRLDIVGFETIVDLSTTQQFKEYDENLEFIGRDKTYLINDEFSGIYTELFKILNGLDGEITFDLGVDFHKMYISSNDLSDKTLKDILGFLLKNIKSIIERYNT